MEFHPRSHLFHIDWHWQKTRDTELFRNVLFPPSVPSGVILIVLQYRGGSPLARILLTLPLLSQRETRKKGQQLCSDVLIEFRPIQRSVRFFFSLNFCLSSKKKKKRKEKRARVSKFVLIFVLCALFWLRPFWRLLRFFHEKSDQNSLFIPFNWSVGAWMIENHSGFCSWLGSMLLGSWAPGGLRR